MDVLVVGLHVLCQNDVMPLRTSHRGLDADDRRNSIGGQTGPLSAYHEPAP